MPEDSKHKNFFKEAAADFRVDPLETTWDKIYPQIGRRLFFRFSFARFNVFYLSAMMAMAGYAGYATWKNVILKNEIKKIYEARHAETLHNDSISIGNTDADSIYVIQGRSAGHKAVTINGNKYPSLNDRTGVEGTDSLANEANQALLSSDTIPNSTSEQEHGNESVETMASQPTQLRQKTVIKKVVVIKPEPVVVRDTVVVKKKNSSKSKK